MLLAALVGCDHGSQPPPSEPDPLPTASPAVDPQPTPTEDGGVSVDAGVADAGAEQDAGPTSPTDGGEAPDMADAGAMLDGAVLYAQHCATCHGTDGNAGDAPDLVPYGPGATLLLLRTDSSMPPSDPTDCTGACAEAVVDHLLSLDPDHGTPGSACDDDGGGPRRKIRLLSRRELQASVHHTLSAWTASTPTTCSEESDCDWWTSSCNAGSCTVDTCGTLTFDYDAQGASPQSVHVAGSFNGWAPTVDDGGWPLHHDAVSGRWRLKQFVGNGRHSYKIVVDGEWHTDGNAPAFEDDGFGGQNSVVDVSCDAGGLSSWQSVDDWAADFPVEAPPSHFPFAHYAATGLVTSNHISASLALAERATALVIDDVVSRFACTTAFDIDCARTLATTLGAEALRRPLDVDEVNRLAQHAVDAQAQGGAHLHDGVRVLLRMLLAHPSFVYRTELGSPVDGGHQLTAAETASAMSYLLWGAPPDVELRQAAADGLLSTSEGRRQQAERMWSDPRTQQHMADFAAAWWSTDKVEQVAKNGRYDGFSLSIRQALARESRDLFVDVAFGDGDFSQLFTSPTSRMDAALAAWYGLPAPDGDGRVDTTDNGRAGVLGHAALLAVLAYPDQSSPVRRGLFVRERLLCQDLGTPPPFAGAIPEVSDNLTTRERFEEHGVNPTCYACHRFIDPVGFGFEHFDAVGAHRTEDIGQPVDSSGQMLDLEGIGADTIDTFDSPSSLGALLATSTSAQHCFVQQVWRFASGAFADDVSACALERLQASFTTSGGHIPSLFVDVIADDSFVFRAAEADADGSGGQP